MEALGEVKALLVDFANAKNLNNDERVVLLELMLVDSVTDFIYSFTADPKVAQKGLVRMVHLMEERLKDRENREKH